MIKLIIFDLDGVLIDIKNIHYVALNDALKQYDLNISLDEHHNEYDGLKTNQKLEILFNKGVLPLSSHKKIWEDKQKYTSQYIDNLVINKNVTNTIKKLHNKGYKLACCSNSIRSTVFKILDKLNIMECFELILSNEDVINSKPHSEIYIKCISHFNVLPNEVLIVEDSPVGLISANHVGCNVLRIKNSNDLIFNKIMNKINEVTKLPTPKWVDDDMNVLIPMAGLGSRFKNEGYVLPKPLIDVNGYPMIKRVVDNINVKSNFIFIVQKEHRDKYNLDIILNLISNNCKIIEVDGVTEGAACTTLLAENLINNDKSLLIVNSDQIIDWDSNIFFYKMNELNCDGGIVTFNSNSDKWSYVKTEYGKVVEVSEKKVISNTATCGIYYWRYGSDYVKYAKQMISKNIRTNNEFYVCPVFNEYIKDNKTIITHKINKMWGLGTPEDLKYFNENYKI